MSRDRLLHEELNAAIETRRELGAEMEPAIIDAFVERIERRLAERQDVDLEVLKRRQNHQKDMVLGTMGLSVPLLVIAAVFTGLPGVVAVCLALAVIVVVAKPNQ